MQYWRNWMFVFPVGAIVLMAVLLPPTLIKRVPKETHTAIDVESAHQLTGMHIVTSDKKFISTSHGKRHCVDSSDCRVRNPRPGVYEVRVFSTRAADSISVIFTDYAAKKTSAIEKQLSFNKDHRASFQFELKNGTVTLK